MFFKRVLCLTGLLVVLCCGVCEMPVSAEVVDNNVEFIRASKQFALKVSANSVKRGSLSFSLEPGEEVLIKANYTPASANVDIGIISTDGVFYYVNASNGDVNQTIIVDKASDYTLAVRNNSNDTISAMGYLYY